MTPFIVGGLVLGGIYAIATVGLVLTYRSSRVFNFAHGAIAYVLALVFHRLAVHDGWPRLLAGGFVIVVAGPLLGLGLWAGLFRRLSSAPTSVRLVSTVGLWVALPPFARILLGHGEIFDRTGIGPSPARVSRLFGVVIDSDQLIVLGAALLIAGLAAVVLRFTSVGLAVRAAVDNPTMAGVAGVNTAAVTAGSWMVGVGLAGVAGVLLAPLRGYGELSFTLLLLAAFAAVVIARMASLVLAFAGSLLIGLLQNLEQSRQVQRLLAHVIPPNSVVMKGLQPSIPFLLMVVFLLSYQGLGGERFAIDPRRLSAPAIAAGDRLTEAARSPLKRLVPFAVIFAAVIFAPNVLPGLWQAILAKGLALGIAFLSYTIVTGEGGMISLCQITFAGIAGALTAQLATNHGVPTLLAVFAGAVIVVPLGLLVGLSSLRLGDLYFALATLAFAEVVEATYFQVKSVNNFDSGVAVPRPILGPVNFANDRAFYYLLVALFGVVAVLVVNLKRSTTGLTLGAVRSSEPAAATLGISVLRTKLVAFGFSAFVAGLGGGLYVTYTQRALPAQGFGALIGIVWLTVVVTWGIRSVLGALLAGLSFAVVPALFAQHLSGAWLDVPTVLFGLGAIGLAREPLGIIHDVTTRREQKRRRRNERRSLASVGAGAG